MVNCLKFQRVKWSRFLYCNTSSILSGNDSSFMDGAKHCPHQKRWKNWWQRLQPNHQSGQNATWTLPIEIYQSMGVFHRTDSMWFQVTDILTGIVCNLQMAVCASVWACMRECVSVHVGILVCIIMDPPVQSEKHFTLRQPSAETDLHHSSEHNYHAGENGAEKWHSGILKRKVRQRDGGGGGLWISSALEILNWHYFSLQNRQQ